MQKTEPLQGLFAAVVQSLYGGDPRARGLPDTDVGGLFADRVRQDLPEPVLIAAEKVLLGAEVAALPLLGEGASVVFTVGAGEGNRRSRGLPRLGRRRLHHRRQPRRLRRHRRPLPPLTRGSALGPGRETFTGSGLWAS